MADDEQTALQNDIVIPEEAVAEAVNEEVKAVEDVAAVHDMPPPVAQALPIPRFKYVFCTILSYNVSKYQSW